MKTTPLLILLLSSVCDVIASPQLFERQEQGFWPDWENLGGGLTFLRGVGNFFLDPQDSDSSSTRPPPDTVDTSDKQTSPDSPDVSPASPSIPDPSLSAEPVYKLHISNDPPLLPAPEPMFPAALPPVNQDQECDPTNASPQIRKLFKNETTLPIHDHCVNSD